MQNKLKMLLCLLMIVSSAAAQKPELKTKFGKISKEETDMTAAPSDPAAPAVVLFDKGYVDHRYVNKVGFIQEFERHTRIKIFKKEAYHLADVAFMYYKWQKIGDLKATCYNMENGKLVEIDLEKANVFDEKITRSRMLRKFTIPGVKEGSIIEFKYTITDEDVVGIPNWVFQQVNAPTIWSEYEAMIPTFIAYNKMSQGWEPYTLTEEEENTKNINITISNRGEGLVTQTTTQNVKIEYTLRHMHFIQQNLPAIKPEPFVPAPSDYLSQINFDIQAIYNTDVVPNGGTYKLINTSFKSYNNNWENLGREMLEDVYDKDLNSGKYTKDQVSTCTAGKSTPTEKLTAIYEYVGKNYAVRDYNLIWASQSQETLVKDHKGTATDVNLLMINMLRQAGLKAWPVMISTRSNGKVHPARVVPQAFDRVIAAVEGEDGKVILLNAAAFPQPPGLLEKEDLNESGLLLKSPEEVSWENVQNKVSSREALIANLNIKPEGGITGTVSLLTSGYPTVQQRGHIAQKSAEHMVQQTFKDWAAESTFSEVKVDKPTEWQEAALKTEFKLESTGFATVSGNKIYLTPVLNLGQHENPFKNPERKFNIDLGAPHDESFNITFNIPEGYKVEEAPKSAKIAMGENALSFDYIVETTPQTIKVNVRTKTRKPYFGADEYEHLRQYFTTMSAKLEEQVVLTKI